MNKTLIIAEKPSVALDISRALGGFAREGDYFESDRYVLASSIGHLLSLVAPNDPVKGKWSFTHLPVIPPAFELGPTDKEIGRAPQAAGYGWPSARMSTPSSTPATPGAKAN